MSYILPYHVLTQEKENLGFNVTQSTKQRSTFPFYEIPKVWRCSNYFLDEKDS